MQELVDQIRDLTRRALFTPAGPLTGAASPAEPLRGAVREPSSGEAPPPSKTRASTEIARPSPAPVSATARRWAALRNDKIHRPCFLLIHFYFHVMFCLFCVPSCMATMSFAGYFIVHCLLSVFPAFLLTCSGLTWFGSVYYVTTAGFVADQLM